MDSSIFHPFFFIYTVLFQIIIIIIIKFCFSNKTTKIYLLKINNTGTSRLVKQLNASIFGKICRPVTKDG